MVLLTDDVEGGGVLVLMEIYNKMLALIGVGVVDAAGDCMRVMHVGIAFDHP